MTILTALSQLLPFLSEEETHLALFHGVRARCGGLRRCSSKPGDKLRGRAAGKSTRPSHPQTLAAALAAERTVLTAIVGGASLAALADLLLAAETDRAYADGGHSLDFINKAFECLDVIG